MSTHEKACDAVDCAVFSSDMLHIPEDRAMFGAYLARWAKEFRETDEPTAAGAVPCRHEAFQGRCVHCDAPFVNGGVALAAPADGKGAK